ANFRVHRAGVNARISARRQWSINRGRQIFLRVASKLLLALRVAKEIGLAAIREVTGCPLGSNFHPADGVQERCALRRAGRMWRRGCQCEKHSARARAIPDESQLIGEFSDSCSRGAVSE